MKLLKIELKNIAKHENTTIEINKPLTIIFGDVENGKTTILNAVRWGLGCLVPDKVIKDGCNEADILITFDSATSHRSFYINKEGAEVARPLEYIENGRRIAEPIKYLKTKINPFLLDNEYFMKMSTIEQMKFFVSLFGIDTSSENKILADQEEKNKSLRSEIKGIGEIVPKMVVKPDVEALKKEKETVDAANLVLKEKFDEDSKLATERADEIKRKNIEIAATKEVIENAKLALAAQEKWILDNPELPEVVIPKYAPTTAIEEKISNAKADEILYKAWQEDVLKLKGKTDKETELKDGELLVKETRAAKIAKLESFSDKTGIADLKFIEGGYTYQGIGFDMLSTSARMDLSDKLSALFPSDFDIDLIDRAESLGRKNLINLGEIAAKGKRTIIATVVSDSLAINDENIGIFKVEDGNVVS